MDVREKLVKILADAGMGKTERNFLADHLIMSGITVQEWIPVTERLPDNKEHDWVLAYVVEDNGFMHIPTSYGV